MTISRPAGSAGGVTVAEVNLKFVWDVVSRIQIGQAGIAYVHRRRATLSSRIRTSAWSCRRPEWTRCRRWPHWRSPRRRCWCGARNLKGEKGHAAHTAIPTLNWTRVCGIASGRGAGPAVSLHPLARGPGGGGGLLLSMVASFFLARTLVRPLRALEAGAERIGRGELDQRIDVHTGDELEGLAHQFNKMAAELRASYIGLEAQG